MVKNTGRLRSFTPKTPEKTEPLAFELYDETFECRPAIQGAVILEFLSAGEGDGSGAARQILGFYEQALFPEAFERFSALINDPDRIVDLETLTEIVGWLIEEYTSRPTAAS